MPSTLVQQTGNQFGSVSSQSLTFPSSTTPGNALVALVATYGGNAAGPHAGAITDNKGNTWTRGAARGIISQNAIGVYYCLNAAGGASHTVTFDPSDHGAQYLTFRIQEYSGLATSGGANVTNSAQGTVGNWTVNLVTTVADCLLVGLASHDSSSNTSRTYGGGSGYTVDHNFGNGGTAPPMLAQHKDVGAAGTHAFDGTISVSSPAWMVAAIAIPLASSAGTYTLSGSGTAPAPTGSGTGLTTGAPTSTLSGGGTAPAPTGSGTGLAHTPPTFTLSGGGTAPAPTGSSVTSGILARDTFTAANDTLVTARNSDSGHPWVMQSGSFDDTPFIITANRARSQVGGTNVGLLDYTPPDDYEIVAIVRRLSASEFGVWGRASAVASDGYSLFWSGTRFDLYRYVGGSGTLIGNSEEHASGLSLSDGVTYRVKIRYEIVGGNVVITAWIRTEAAGDDTYTLMLDVTDSNAARHVSPGLAGLNMRNTGASTGMHTDELRVQEVGTTDAGTTNTGGLTFTAPDSTLSGSGTAPAPIGGGAGLTFAPPVFALSGAGAGPAPSGSGAGLAVTPPTYTLSGSGAAPAPTGSGTGLATGTPTSTLSGVGTAPVPSGGGAGLAFAAPTFTLSGVGTAPAPSGGGAGLQFANAISQLSGGGTAPVPTGMGTGLAFAAPVYVLSGSGTAPPPTGTGVGLAATPPAFTLAGSAVAPAPIGGGVGLQFASAIFLLSGGGVAPVPVGAGAGLTFSIAGGPPAVALPGARGTWRGGGRWRWKGRRA